MRYVCLNLCSSNCAILNAAFVCKTKPSSTYDSQWYRIVFAFITALCTGPCTMQIAQWALLVSLCAKMPSWHLVGCQVKWGCIKATNLHSIGIAQSTLLPLLLCKNGSSSATCCAKMANIVARRWGQVGCRVLVIGQAGGTNCWISSSCNPLHTHLPLYPPW